MKQLTSFIPEKMRKVKSFDINNVDELRDKMLHLSGQFDHFVLLDSHGYTPETSKYPHLEFDMVAAVGNKAAIAGNDNGFEKLRSFFQKEKDWMFGHFSYDMKNHTENLVSENHDGIEFPEYSFFVPEAVLILHGKKLQIQYYSEESLSFICSRLFSDEKVNAGMMSDCSESEPYASKSTIEIVPRLTRQEYLLKVAKLKEHIQRGDIYEVNFTQEFSAKCSISPVEVYRQLSCVSPTPFHGFYRLGNKYMLSASPERYLRKKGRKVISQPIKGTIKRGSSPEEDLSLIGFLENSEKERAENVMIVDLVRNDLSRTAAKGSVQVEELAGIYSFTQVHQMISTVSSILDEEFSFVDVIESTFPMGSMTGAPKIRAMELIEDYEVTKRGLYSGAFGFITPDQDFDFSVVIRSILFNSEKNYLSYITGGAITSLSEPEKEYEECLLKAQAMKRALNSD